MRTTLWCSILSAALLIGGCSKKSESQEAMDKASDQAAKARDEMQKERKDVDDQQSRLVKEQAELDTAHTDLVQARAKYEQAAHDRLAAIDTRLHELAARSDAKARAAYADLQVRRDQLAAKLDEINKTANDRWDDFKKGADDTFAKLESDINDALK
jgi:septal ring factor EnvC (AmiA/AmiB activator)